MTEGPPTRGDVRLRGGPSANTLQVSVYDGQEWAPLRFVHSVAYDAEAGHLPRLMVWFNSARLDVIAPREGVGFEVLRDTSHKATD